MCRYFITSNEKDRKIKIKRYEREIDIYKDIEQDLLFFPLISYTRFNCFPTDRAKTSRDKV